MVTDPHNLESGMGLLKVLVERNEVVELHWPPTETQQGGLMRRVRLLDVRHDSITVERPVPCPDESLLEAGRSIRLLVMDRNLPVVIQTRLLDRATVLLNESTRVPALLLERPSEVRSHQRREFFRLRVEDMTPMAIDLYGYDPSTGRKSSFHLSAEVCQLGGGGADVTLNVADAAFLQEQTQILVEFMLPETRVFIQTPARICHALAHGRDDLRLGLAFLAANDAETRRIADEICRHNAIVQRKLIQQQRSRL